MASSGKKGKKSKGKTIALTEFLADGSTGAPVPVRCKAWADEVENDDDSFDMSGSRNKQPVILPTAPRATRSPNVDDENIPRHPPFNAYISNLQYDVDEEEITEFFKDMKIVTVRLPRDDRGSGRLKGFGYVEFESRESLISALNIPDTTIKGRRIRIEIASNSDNERRGGRNTRDMGYDRGDGPDRTLGDWRSGPREDLPSDNGRDGPDGPPRSMDRGSFTRDNMNGPSQDRGFSRDADRGSFTRDNMNGSFNRDSDRGAFTRDNMNGPSQDRQPFHRDSDRSFTRDSGDRGAFTRENMNGPDRQPFNRDGDRSFSRDNDRSFSRDGDRGGFSRDNDRSFNRDNDRGFGRDNDRGFNRDNNQDRGSFTRDNMNGPPSQDRSYSREGGDGNRREDSVAGGGFDRGFRSGFSDRGDGERFSGRREFREAPRLNKDEVESQPPQSETVKERPKLNLAPRTVTEAGAPGSEPVQAAIFGGARPVDTAAKEREIEERLAKIKEQAVRPEAPAEPAKSPSSVPATEETKPQATETPAQGPAVENAWHRRMNPENSPAPPGTKSAARHHYAADAGSRGGKAPRVPRTAAPAPKPRPAEPRPEKDPNEVPRMPKLREQAAPNFIASNKYGNLPIDEDLAID